MGLGNNSSMGQARGKNKGTVAKTAREYYTARNYRSFSVSPRQASDSCSLSVSLSETYFHDGAGALPTADDIVYARKRAEDPHVFNGGHYKVNDGRRNMNLEINDSGVVIRVSLCP
tara:strand:+ start:553 stop:900 length:348 start_codon:yes stop_codon:yes gene_type:complete